MSRNSSTYPPTIPCYRCTQCVCLRYYQRLIFSHSFLDSILDGPVFFFLFVIGSSGNLLNFVILMSKQMRSKTNMFLSAMAFADLAFFVSLFPTKLNSVPWIEHNMSYINFHMVSHVVLIAMANWFSAASTWLAVGVAIERLIAVRFPLHVRQYLKKRYILGAVICIYGLSFSTVIHHFVFRELKRVPLCQKNTTSCESTTNDDSYGYMWDVPNPKVPSTRSQFVQVSIVSAIVVTVAIPFIVLLVLNTALLKSLKESQKKQSHLSEGSQKNGRQSQCESRITRTVSALILIFLFSNCASCYVYMIDMFLRLTPNRGKRSAIMESLRDNQKVMSPVSNTLVIIGKTLNFITYCLSSVSFRRKLVKIICYHSGVRKRVLQSKHFAVTSMNIKKRRFRNVKVSLKNWQSLSLKSDISLHSTKFDASSIASDRSVESLLDDMPKKSHKTDRDTHF